MRWVVLGLLGGCLPDSHHLPDAPGPEPVHVVQSIVFPPTKLEVGTPVTFDVAPTRDGDGIAFFVASDVDPESWDGEVTFGNDVAWPWAGRAYVGCGPTIQPLLPRPYNHPSISQFTVSVAAPATLEIGFLELTRFNWGYAEGSGPKMPTLSVAAPVTDAVAHEVVLSYVATCGTPMTLTSRDYSPLPFTMPGVAAAITTTVDAESTSASWSLDSMTNDWVTSTFTFSP